MTLRTPSLDRNGWVPSNPDLPALLYAQALRPAEAEARLGRNGWPAPRRGGIFGLHHSHSNAHEVLAVTSGAARASSASRREGRWRLPRATCWCCRRARAAA